MITRKLAQHSENELFFLLEKLIVFYNYHDDNILILPNDCMKYVDVMLDSGSKLYPAFINMLIMYFLTHWSSKHSFFY
jgi:hypothetical protein